MSDVRRIGYVCTRCSEEDTVKLWPNEPVPPAINCWNCHAGYKSSHEDMIVNQVGMFPTVAQVAV